MIAAIRIYLVAFLATVLGTLTASPIWATPETPTPIYTYNALADSAPRDSDALERGPPAARDPFTNREAVNRRVDGSLVRPHKATPSEATTSNHPAPLVQVAHVPAAVRGHVGGLDGDLAALSDGGVAANTAPRLAQDLAVSPVAPRALPLTGRFVGRATHDAEIQKILSGLDGATDIRINQQQVNALGQRVGINRPDLQYTLDGRRHYVEIEGLANPRGAGHQTRIGANDPTGAFDLRLVN